MGLRQRALSVAAFAVCGVAALGFVALAFTSAGAMWLVVWIAIGALSVTAMIFALSHVFAPVGDLAHLLEACAEGEGGRGAPQTAIDDAARMRANAQTIAARLEKLKVRPRRHALTRLPLQEEFLRIASNDIDGNPKSVLMGLVRLANYDAMAAFDPVGAERVLGLFARRLKDALDPSRAVAHIDRDCFAIWFRGVAPHKQSAAELQALSYVLSQEIEADAFVVSPDVQIGSALYPVDSTDAANLLSRAFVSLARPQRTAEGGLAFFASSSPDVTRRRFTIEQELRHAIERQQLELHYQAFIDVGAGEMTGAEALLRWRHPTLGVISPSEFIPILEDTGLIEDFGLWAIGAVSRQLRQWRDAGQTFTVSLNISARQLRDPMLGKIIVRALSAHKLSPADLELELTETAAMEDATRTLALFNELRSLGFGLSIDDFGSGYSSLGYLKNLPFTKLKIDREFVTHVDTRPGSRAICKALIELCNGLGITVLAEGVERFEEVETLRRLGCATFQGFYFAPAMPASALIHASADWRALAQSPIHRQQAELRRRVSE